MSRGSVVEVEIERVVAGGLGLGHEGAGEHAGRVVLAAGALPGERVAVELERSKRRFAQGHAIEVLRASELRIDPPCPEVARGCGGCDLQMAPATLQRELKVGIVADSLAHLGRLPDVPISAGEQLVAEGYRTTLRCGVVDGRAGFHRRRSNEIHVVQSCRIAHPAVREIVEQGRFPGAKEVTIRVGARTGDRLVIVSPSVGDTVVPDGVQVIGADQLADGADAHFHELVARRRFRVSANSFFQARPDGAEALVRAVERAIAPFDPAEHRLVDLYGGVGLFTLALGALRSVVVERSPSSCEDARVNLVSLGAAVEQVAVEQVAVERWRPTAADVVIADPARAGLGAEGVAQVVETGAERVALVSCDPASLARDARLLVDAGYRAGGVELVDMFPQTHHVEAVTSFARGSAT